MSEQEIKRCPFRKDENDDFAPCYGTGCMAYYEYDRPVLPVTTCGNYVAEYVRTTGCYRLSVIAPYSGGCA